MAGAVKPIVLIVEDEPMLRFLAIAMFEDAGFDTVDSRSADEAIGILEARIVFTDIDMPGSMDGMRLAAVIRDRWPPIEIVITSGEKRPEPEVLPSRCRFFAKPYDADAVLNAIREFLN